MRKSTRGVSVESAGLQLGMPDRAVRVLMRREKLPIGIAEKIGGTKYSYYISQELIDKYLCKVTSPIVSEEKHEVGEEGQANE